MAECHLMEWSLMAILKSNCGKDILVCEQDYILFKFMKWRISKIGYAQTRKTINKKAYMSFMHSLIIKPKTGFVADHINQNKLDNRRCNLRLVSKSQNAINSKLRSDNSSGFRGVSKTPNGRYYSYINHEGKRHRLGFFDCPIEAAKARDEKAVELFGNHASLNFPK